MSESFFVLEDLKKQMIVRHSKIPNIMGSIHLHHFFAQPSFNPVPSKARKYKTSWYHSFRFGSKAFDYVVQLLSDFISKFTSGFRKFQGFLELKLPDDFQIAQTSDTEDGKSLTILCGSIAECFFWSNAASHLSQPRGFFRCPLLACRGSLSVNPWSLVMRIQDPADGLIC